MSKAQLISHVVCKVYLAGHSVNAISAALGLSRRSVISKIVRAGVYTPDAPYIDPETQGY